MRNIIVAASLVALLITLTGCSKTSIPYEYRADIQYAINAESSIKPENPAFR